MMNRSHTVLSNTATGKCRSLHVAVSREFTGAAADPATWKSDAKRELLQRCTRCLVCSLTCAWDQVVSVPLVTTRPLPAMLERFVAQNILQHVHDTSMISSKGR